MKRHDEDLWDFRSDPIFGDKKQSSKSKPADTSPQPSEEDTAEADYTEYRDEYVDILRTSTARDSSLDNMTFVMRDGKASFIDNSLVNPPEKEEAEEKPKEAMPEKPQRKVTEDKTSVKEDKKVKPEPISQDEPIIEEKTAETPNVVPPVVSAPEKTKDSTPSESKAETTVPDNLKPEASSDSEPVSEPEPVSVSEVSKEDQPAEKPKETKTPSTEKEVPQENKAKEENKAPSAQNNVQDNSKDQKKLSDSSDTTPKKKVPATDSDFIFAKPHSKKKSHSHSQHSHNSHHSHSHKHSPTSELPADSVDDYVFARYRKQKGSHHHHHKGKSVHSYDYMRTPDNEATTVVCSTTASHYRTKHVTNENRKWRKRPLWQKLLIILGWVLGILLVLALIGLILFLIFSRIGINNMTDYSDAQINAPTFENISVKVEDEGKTQIYNGKEYRLNSDIANILCIGVDKQNIYEKDNNSDSSSLSDNGQGDALFLVALNTKTGETTVLSIPRDTMTDINVYDKNGKFLKTETLQICQSYAYGDGSEGSCNNTKDAVSRLFYQFPIQTYFAMDLSAIAPINDTIGGVKVTMIDDSFYDVNNIHHEKGDRVLLRGDNARKYVQQRDVNHLESTTNRLARQINYLKAFSKKTLAKTKKDITTPVNLYNVISENSISNLDVYKISALAKCLIENGVTDLNFKTIPGNLQSDGTYAQYIVDNEKFYELFLETYYVPVD